MRKPCSLKGTRAASATFVKTRGDRDSPKGRTLYLYARPSNANRRTDLWCGKIDIWKYGSFRSTAADRSRGRMHPKMHFCVSILKGGLWKAQFSGGPRRGLSVRCTFTCFHSLAEGAWVAFDDALEPPTAACWQEDGWVGSGVDPPITLHALLGPRDRDNLFLSRFLKQQIIHPALLRGRERCTYPLLKQFPLSLGRWSRGLLLLRLPTVDGDQGGRGGLPTPSSTAPHLKASADAVQERGWMQGAALGDEQAGRIPMSARHSQRWHSWTTSVDIAWPRDCAITFVAGGARLGAVWSSFRTYGSWPPPCMSLMSLKNLQ